jgi:DNA invertase Pin-like site-specific DNA recombinase
METKTDVIYARYSSELQRVERIQDQVRRCRDGLDRLGIAHDHFEVIKDEAISGTQESRPGLDQIKAMIAARRLGKLVVAEQSRLTRNDNAKSQIKDILFQGGRFIAIAEGIDTDKKGWQLPVAFSEMHHSRSNEDTGERVRGGQEGRVLDADGSAGDFPFGYKSEYVDPAAALNYHGRGPKPRKRVVIDEPAGRVVREIFERFARGASITSITRWLSEIQHTIPRIGKGDWHHQHVRRILANTKYIGTWKFGQTTTVRDSAGRKKQVKARTDQKVITRERPHLRIIEQPL